MDQSHLQEEQNSPGTRPSARAAQGFTDTELPRATRNGPHAFDVIQGDDFDLPQTSDTDLKSPVPDLNLDGHVQKPKSKSRPQDRVVTGPRWSPTSDQWTWEVGSAIVSIAAVLSIVGVLVAYDQKPAPLLPKGITVNAVISFLTTIAKACMVLSVAAAIGQSKWLWFQDDSRILQDIELFDDASRGPLGSLRMLSTRHVSLFTLIGAFCLVASIGMDSLVQQLIVFKTRNVPLNSKMSSIAAPRNYSYVSIDQKPSDFNVTALLGILGAVTSSRAEPTCPGGDCDWPNYHALALCSHCERVPSERIIGVDLCNITLSRILSEWKGHKPKERHFAGPSFHPSYTVPADFPIELMIDSVFSQSIEGTFEYDILYPSQTVWALNFDTFDDGFLADWFPGVIAGIVNPLVGLGYLSLQPRTDSDATYITAADACECAITPCVREYQRAVHGAKLSSRVLSTHYGTFDPHGDGMHKPIWAAVVNGTNFTLQNDWTNVYLSIELLINGLQSALVGAEASVFVRAFNSTGNYIFDGNNTQILGWSSLQAEAVAANGNFSAVVDSVATALSALFEAYSVTHVAGRVLGPETYMEVRWGWIAFPVVLVLLGMVTLFGVMLQTRKYGLGVWKTSFWPLFYRFSRGDVDGGKISGYEHGDLRDCDNSIARMRLQGKREHVRLMESKSREGGRFWVLRGAKKNPEQVA